VGSEMCIRDRRKNDRLVIDGREREIVFVKPFVIGDTLVRIELTVGG
jgi:hypothetical protein